MRVTGKPTGAASPVAASPASRRTQPRVTMLSVTPPTLAAATPLGVQAVPVARATAPIAWRRVARIAGRVVAACAAALAAGFVISLGVAAAFLLIAIAVT
jgi:hypothetical protein